MVNNSYGQIRLHKKQHDWWTNFHVPIQQKHWIEYDSNENHVMINPDVRTTLLKKSPLQIAATIPPLKLHAKRPQKSLHKISINSAHMPREIAYTTFDCKRPPGICTYGIRASVSNERRKWDIISRKQYCCRLRRRPTAVTPNFL